MVGKLWLGFVHKDSVSSSEVRHHHSAALSEMQVKRRH